jgi:hypothetical protein
VVQRAHRHAHLLDEAIEPGTTQEVGIGVTQ